MAIKERNKSERLSEDMVQKKIGKSVGWTIGADPRAIEKVYKRKDFRDAIRFIERIADVAEQHDHHPDILLFGYRNVKVTFSTHSAGGLTENDFEMAALVNGIE